MAEFKELKQKIISRADEIADEAWETALFIHSHPEDGGKEVESSRRLISVLEQNHFSLRMPYGGMDTAFRGDLSGLARTVKSLSATETEASAGEIDDLEKVSEIIVSHLRRDRCDG